MGITILLTEGVGFGVLALEVEDVNRESNVIEEWVIGDHLCQCAVIIIKYMVRLKTRGPIDPLDHFLDDILAREIHSDKEEITHNDTRNSLRAIERLASNDYSTWGNEDLFQR